MERLGIPLQGVAVAIDYEVVPKGRWHETVLHDCMELMMIRAVSGGGKARAAKNGEGGS